jgi:prevent-host-death family protein
MKLPIAFPARLGPGQSWRVPEDKLDEGLQIGSVCTARTSGGHEAEFLVDAAYRERDGLRYYDLVWLADRIELRDAQPNLDALISHVSRTGRPVTLTINGADAARLLPRSAPHPDDKRAVEEFHARVADRARSSLPASGRDVDAAPHPIKARRAKPSGAASPETRAPHAGPDEPKRGADPSSGDHFGPEGRRPAHEHR